jgi:hypothetical protein
MSTDAAAHAAIPKGPTDLPKRSWWQTIKRTVDEFRDDNITDWAAALTYYAVLALFPALIVLVAILGLLGQDPKTTDSLFQILREQLDHRRGARAVAGRHPLQGRRLRPARDWPGRSGVVGVWLPRSLHPRVQRDLRGA